MGNTNSSDTNKDDKLKPTSQSRILDYIATHYILTMDFVSLRQLYKPEYCNKLVILTSDIIEQSFTGLELSYLVQRVKNGENVNIIDKDKVVFFDKDELLKLDVKNSFKKKNMCLSIGKFYVKIAHVFAAIVMTINPTYVYKNDSGEIIRANLYEKGKIPPNAPRKIYKLNICDNRINALEPSKSKQENNIITDNKTIIHPKVCSMNITNSGDVKTLANEIGIPQLRELYNDDGYNYDTGNFDKMSPETKKIFEEDLGIFYEVFTGNPKSDIATNNISDFSDIQLKDYNTMCNLNKKQFEPVTGDSSNSLFIEYADHLANMIRNAKKNQSALLEIMDKIFVYTIDPQTKKKTIRISPDLTEIILQELVVKTRELIITLYLQCEMDFSKGIYIYEAIVLQKSLDSTQSQTLTLEKEKDKLRMQENDAQIASFK